MGLAPSRVDENPANTVVSLISDVIEVPPINEHSNVIEIAGKFGGIEQLREAIRQLQSLLYAAA